MAKNRSVTKRKWWNCRPCLWLNVRNTKMIICLSYSNVIVFLLTSSQLCTLWNQGTHPIHPVLQIYIEQMRDDERNEEKYLIPRIAKCSDLIFNAVRFSYHTKCSYSGWKISHNLPVYIHFINRNHIRYKASRLSEV